MGVTSRYQILNFRFIIVQLANYISVKHTMPHLCSTSLGKSACRYHVFLLRTSCYLVISLYLMP